MNAGYLIVPNASGPRFTIFLDGIALAFAPSLEAAERYVASRSVFCGNGCGNDAETVKAEPR
jgi:hypothetical protein